RIKPVPRAVASQRNDPCSPSFGEAQQTNIRLLPEDGQSMCYKLSSSLPALVAAAALALATPVLAQVSGQGGADRPQLPAPDPEFKGTIGETYKDSTPYYPRSVTAPAEAPNVLLILLDDVGFGMASPFGGPVPTPNLDRLAHNGLSYTRFHTTALCSPTRAAL